MSFVFFAMKMRQSPARQRLQCLEALADRMHEDHDDLLRCCGQFDPKKYDANQATKLMTQGLPDCGE